MGQLLLVSDEKSINATSKFSAALSRKAQKMTSPQNSAPVLRSMEEARERAREVANRMASMVNAGDSGTKDKDQNSDSDLGKRTREEPPPSIFRPPPALAAAAPIPTTYYPGMSLPPPVPGIVQEMRVPNTVVGAIIGKGGENLAKLQRETGASMTVARENEMPPGETLRLITIKGTPENARVLHDRLEALVSDRLAQAAAGPNVNEVLAKKFNHHMPVPNTKVGAVIGRGGATMRQIQERTGATLKIPSGPDNNNPEVRTIAISADSEGCILAAQAEIAAIVASGPSGNSSATMGYTGAAAGGANVRHVVPDDKVGSIIGKAGTTVKELQARLGVKIQIPSGADPHSMPPVRTLTLSGPPDAVYRAIREIDDRVNYTAGGQRPAQGAAGGMYGAPSSGSYYQQAAAPAVDTSYYADYWNYASHYGEKAARLYYQTWSPPVGTPPPLGIAVAKDMTPAELAAAAAAAAAKSSGAAAAPATAGTGNLEDTEEWKAYAQNYRTWWLEHGKAAGASEKPPAI